MVGNTILGYHVDEKIGSGGFGTVYKVSKTNAAGTYVRALKHITLPTKKQYTSVLNSMGGDYSKADDYFSGILQDIVGEISILSTLSESGTQNIVRYYENDIIETPSPKTYDIYILMEFLTPFTDYVENNSFTVRDVINLGKDILKALIACHDKKIIHRDIKDDNIFVSPDGIYKLGDFGVSKALKDKSRAESMKGTPNFIAPEVYLGKETYDDTVDIYSLGIVLYKLLNMSRNPFLPKYPAPYTSQDEDLAFEARMTGRVPELPVSAENQLGEAVLKAIMPRRDRYNTAAEFYEVLQKVEASLSEEELSKQIGMTPVKMEKTSVTPHQTVSSNRNNDETVGVDILQNLNETVEEESDRHLFDTIGSTYEPKPAYTPSPAPKQEYTPSPEPNQEYGSVLASKHEYAPESPAQAYTPPTPPPSQPVSPPSEPPKVSVVMKKDFTWLIYVMPLLIFIVGFAAILLIWSGVKGVSFGDIMNFAATFKLSEVKTYLQELETMVSGLVARYIASKIVFIVTIALFAISLFFVGYTINKKRAPKNPNAQVDGKTAYYLSMELLSKAERIRGGKTDKTVKAVRVLCERLKNSDDFGSGSNAVIQCENEIVAILRNISQALSNLASDQPSNGVEAYIESQCDDCMAKLKIRTEMKKR